MSFIPIKCRAYDMSVTPCLVDRWSEENNGIISRWKQNERSLEPNQDVQKRCYSESLKLHQKIQGIPAATERLKLEMTVSYNRFLFSLGFSISSEIEESLTHILLRALDAVGSQVPTSDPVMLWQVVLQTFGTSVFVPYVHKLLLIQWMLWLMQCQLDKILALLKQTNNKKELSAPVNLQTVIRNLALTMEEDSSLMVAMAAKDLKDLLHICTVIAQGVEQMNEEKYSEALEAFQEAKGHPSPRRLLAQIHTLTGQSFAKLAIQLQSDKSSSSASLVSPAMLLAGDQMTCISRVPSPSLILHSLARTCMLNSSISDGVEHYLDLLASLQSEGKELISTGDGTSFPRIPVVYLEAAFALFKAQKYRDALVICEEVITSTLDFIPERLLLDLPMAGLHLAGSTTVSPDSDIVLENVDFVLWAGAAHLLQAQAHWKLKDNKEAITNFTRAVNQLVKVFIKQKDWKQKTLGNTEAMVEKMLTLDAAKGQALAGRGLCFLEKGQLKEALRDLHLSLQICPGCKNTEMWLTEVFWRLDRKDEALVHWREAHNATNTPTSIKLPLYLQAWQDDTVFDFSDLKKKMEDFIQTRNVKKP
ncbi:Fanconi anemia group G protein isoform X3 [Myxocyprinus asiaticus]|uniref:Fanconi anemia group G protein isoform X3 n=1 Tax=Myxocyprinus asiaticus TaxID=70543 RepID=UPI002223CA49|nr:Fanconi anemia group G protein isoform X3 [Myxocyprinus asiaticus]